MPVFKLIPTGTRFGRLVVIGPPDKTSRFTKYPCVCDCGGMTNSIGAQLRNRTASSCGCARRETLRAMKTTHGEKKTPLYQVWCGMKARCYNKKHISFKNYGALGITVCEQWKTSFSDFREWAFENGYMRGLTLERNDGAIGYSPSNCRWATWLVQNNNSRHVNYISFNGKRQSIAAWARELGMRREKLSNRINSLNWGIERAITTP